MLLTGPLNCYFSNLLVSALLKSAQVQQTAVRAGSYDSGPAASRRAGLALVVQLLNSIESLLGATADLCTFPSVKDLLCRGRQPGPSAAPQHVSVGHLFSSLHVVFFIAAYCDFIQAAPAAFNSSLPPAAWNLHGHALSFHETTHTHTRTFVCCLIYSFPLSLLYER